MGRIMAIDYGSKRCGIAVTDPLKIFATGLDTVATKELHPFIKAYHTKEVIETMVLGIPYRFDGSLSLIAKDIEKFMDEINSLYPEIKLDGIDETLSSQRAMQSLVQAGVPRMKRRDKGLVDKVSATLLLQAYLEQHAI